MDGGGSTLAREEAMTGAGLADVPDEPSILDSDRKSAHCVQEGDQLTGKMLSRLGGEPTRVHQAVLPLHPAGASDTGVRQVWRARFQQQPRKCTTCSVVERASDSREVHAWDLVPTKPFFRSPRTNCGVKAPAVGSYESAPGRQDSRFNDPHSGPRYPENP